MVYCMCVFISTIPFPPFFHHSPSKPVFFSSLCLGESDKQPVSKFSLGMLFWNYHLFKHSCLSRVIAGIVRFKFIILFYFFFLYSAIPYKYFVWFPFCYRYEAFLHFFWLWWYVMHLKLYVFLPVTYIFNFYNKPYLLSGCLLCYLGAASCWMRSPACGICQWQKIVMIRSSVCSTIYSIFQQFGSFVYFNFSHLIFCQYHKGWDLFHSTECYVWLYSWVILD